MLQPEKLTWSRRTLGNLPGSIIAVLGHREPATPSIVVLQDAPDAHHRALQRREDRVCPLCLCLAGSMVSMSPSVSSGPQTTTPDLSGRVSAGSLTASSYSHAQENCRREASALGEVRQRRPIRRTMTALTTL
jgi:hypothetical protein